MSLLRLHIILVLLLVFTGSSYAQSGFYIPPKGKVHFSGDTSTIFSNVSNNGKLGIGKNAVVNFKGQSWENDPASQITDETDTTTGTGGWVRFIGDTIRQQLYGGYNTVTKLGPAFAHLQIGNKNGIELINGSVKVKRQVAFSDGLVYLNDKIFAVGDQNPGVISGYNSSRYFVTGLRVNGGMLLRENIQAGDSLVVFPVGTKVGAYTPAAIQSRSLEGDDYYVNVFEGARSRLLSGSDLKDSGVNKTWQIGKVLHPGEGQADVFLQHLNADEGVSFTINKKFAYVSQYLGNFWDLGFPAGTPSSGFLTTGQALQNSGVNKRTFTLSSSTFFTKLAMRDTALKTKLVFGGYRVNSNIVKLNWQTKPEVDVKYFVVQRRKANEAGFSNIDTIYSQALNGLSLATLLYSLNDSNNYKGISFYRLQVFEYNNSNWFSNIIAINGAGFNVINLWPNPTPDEFYMIVNSPAARMIVIFNVLGQKMWSRPIDVNAQTYIHVKGHGLISGNYYVSILDGEGKILHTEKLVIVR